MDNSIPPSSPFKKNALSHIPFDIVKQMEQETKIAADELEALHEQVLKKGPSLHASVPNHGPIPVPTPQQPLAIPPQQPAFMSYAINGHVINVPLEETSAAIMLFYTLLAFVWGKDKKVAKILKQFDFKFYDANKVQVYPEVKKSASSL